MLTNVTMANLGWLKMIQIENLTIEQVDMLDMMWSLDSEQEFLDWYESLDTNDQRMADLLQRMVILAELDEQSLLGEMSEAKQMLKKFVLH